MSRIDQSRGAGSHVVGSRRADRRSETTVLDAPALGGAATTSLVSRPNDWVKSYRRRLAVTDVLIIASTMAAFSAGRVLLGGAVAPLWFTASGAALWLVAVGVADSRAARSAGAGTAEYKALLDGTLVFVGVYALVSIFAGIDLRRGELVPAIPVCFLLLVAGRWVWRQWLRRERAAGRALSRVLLVGSSASNAFTAGKLDRHPDAGYRVVGTIVPNDDGVDRADAVLSRRIAEELVAGAADTVVVTSSDRLTAQRVRRLSWQLERADVKLVLSPSLDDVAGSRIQTQPVAGLPLIHIESPNYTGPQRTVKRAVDIVGAALLLAVFAPLLAVVAAAIAVTDRGPVLYRQERVGRDGRTFGILKFRSMIVDADDRLAGLLLEQRSAHQPLFKVESDPRVTRIGAVIRRYSIDELPQLVNVLLGEMSLVGPRPQRPAEVALYDDIARRRLAVRPGMSGLWQVSGRSRLGWDEALRLDLYYIENWSLTADMVILWRTLRAVAGSDGAC